jgi:hypothetical protein
LALASPYNIENSGTIELDSVGGAEATILSIDQPFATLDGGGRITMTNHFNNLIGAVTSGDQLTNLNNTISGSGEIGYNGLVVVNQGIIDANLTDTNPNGPNGTGIEITSPNLTNSGTIETTGTGSQLAIEHGANNTNGLIAAAGTDTTLQISGTVTGGSVTIAATDTLSIYNSAALDNIADVQNSGAVQIDSASSLTLDNSEISGGTVDVDNADSFLIGAGTSSVQNTTLTNYGTIESQGGTLTIETGHTVVNAGTLGTTATGTLLVIEDSVNNSAGTIVAAGTNSLVELAGSAVGGLTVSGGAITIGGSTDKLSVEGTGATLSDVDVTNSGTVQVDPGGGGGTIKLILSSNTAITGGTLTEGGTTGAVEIAAGTGTGATLDDVGVTNAIPITIDALATLTLDGGTTISGSPITNGGTILATGTSAIDNAIIANTGGTLSVSGTTLTLDGDTVTNGTITGSGGGILNIDSGSMLTLNGVTASDGTASSGTGTVDNSGTIKLTGALTLAGTAFTLALDDGGTVLLNGQNIGVTTSGETLQNDGNTIKGGGSIGSGGTTPLTLDNASGTIEAFGAGATLTIKTGAPVINEADGTLEATTGATLQITAGTVDNSGNIQIAGTLAADQPTANGGKLTLNDAGTVTLAGGTIKSDVSGNQLDNNGNTIAGFGQIGDGTDTHLVLNNNSGIVEAQSGFLTIQTGNTVTNAGALEAASGATLQIDDAVTNTGTIHDLASAHIVLDNTTITNGGAITLDAGTAGAQTTLLIDGVVTLQEETSPSVMVGTVTLAVDSQIISSNPGVATTLVNASNTISGAGTLGDSPMTIDNDAAGTIDATGFLGLDAGTVNNAGLLEATTGGTLQIFGDVDNSGTIKADGGTVDVTGNGAITGTMPSVTIMNGGLADFAGSSSQPLALNAQFSGTGTLELEHAQEYRGTISGFGPGDALDLRDLAFATSGEQLAWDSADHTLTVSGGGQSAALVLAGTYTQANFAVMGDSGGGTSGDAKVTFVTQPPVLGGATSDTVAAGGPVTLGAIDLASSSADTLGTVTITGLAHDLTGFNGGTYTANTGTWTGTAAEFNALTFDAGAAGMSTLEISATTVGAAVPATEGYTLTVNPASDDWQGPTSDNEWSTDANWSLGSPPGNGESAYIFGGSHPSVDSNVTIDGASVSVQSGSEIDVGVTSGATLTLDDDSTISGGGAITVASGGTLGIEDGPSGSGATLSDVGVTDNGAIDIADTSQDPVLALRDGVTITGSGSGRLTIGANAYGALDVEGGQDGPGATLDGVAVTDNGTIYVGTSVSGTILTLDDGASITGGGTGAMTIGSAGNTAEVDIVGGANGAGATLDGVAVNNSYGVIAIHQPSIPLNYTTADDPGEAQTSLSGINNAGEIVGTGADGGADHSYIVGVGNFDFTDSSSAYSVNASGVIVGGDDGGAYENDAGTITSIDAFTGYSASGIDDNGDIVAVLGGQPVIDIAGTITDLNLGSAAGPASSIAISANGTIAISYAASSVVGTVSGGFHAVDVPAGDMVVGINDNGQLVGYSNANNEFGDAFLIDNGTIYRIDVSGATGTRAQGINDSGEIVGGYFDSNFIEHGFTTTVAAVEAADQSRLTLDNGTTITGGSLTIGSSSFPDGVLDVEAGSGGGAHGATLDDVAVQNYGTIQVDPAEVISDLILSDGTMVTGGALSIGPIGEVEIETGSGTNGNGATLDGVTVTNQGTLQIDGEAFATFADTVTLQGGGTLALGAGSQINGAYDGDSNPAQLDNIDNTITGSGQIGDTSADLALTNSGVIDAYDATLTINTGNTIVNSGLIEATDSGTLLIQDAEIDNTGSGPDAGIVIDGTSELLVGNSFLDLTGGGTVTLEAGAQILANVTSPSMGAVILENISGTIHNSGTIGGGDGFLVLRNDAAGIIDADSPGAALVLDTGNTIGNSGTLEATSGGILQIDDAVDNSGNGIIEVNGGAVDFANGNTASDNVTFTGAGGTLQLDASQSYSGTISGFSAGDTIDLTDVAYSASGETLAWDSGDNTLTVSNGSQTAAIVLSDSYAEDGFAVAPDGGQGTAVLTNLVTNGGFATGDFTGWTLTDHDNGNFEHIVTQQSSVDAIQPHSGNYEYEIGTGDQDSELAQTIVTVPGNTYQVEFWLANPAGDPQVGETDFSADFGGTQLLSLMNSDVQGYTGYTFDVTATGSSTSLQFFAQNNPGFWYLDDVSVVALTGVPVITAPAAQTLNGDATALTGISLAETGAASDATFTLTLTDTTGILAATASGGTVSDPGTTLTITGTLDQINTDLLTLNDTDNSPDTIFLNASNSKGADALQQTIAITPGSGGGSATADNWTGNGGDGLWSDTNNWDNGVPDSSGAVDIASSGSIIVTFDSEASPATIYSLETSGTATLDVDGSLTILNDAGMSGPVAVGSGGSLYAPNGTLYLAGNAGLVEINDDGTLYLASDIDNSGGTIAAAADETGSTIQLANITISNGTLTLDALSTLLVGDGTGAVLDGVDVTSSGTINISANGAILTLQDNATVTGGALNIGHSGSGGELDIETGAAGFGSGATLEDITVTNNGAIDIGDTTSGAYLAVGFGTSIDGGTLSIAGGSAADFFGGVDPNTQAIVFPTLDGVTVDNSGEMTIEPGGTLQIADTVTLQGGGTVQIESQTEAPASITGTGSPNAELDNVDNTIVGTGDGGIFGNVVSGMTIPLILDNESAGTIDADGSNTQFDIATGAEIVNAGLIEAINGATMDVSDAVDNTGTLVASGATLNLFDNVEGAGGAVAIDNGGTVQFQGSVDQETVTFTGPGTLALGDPAHFHATIAGLTAGDIIDLTALSPTDVASVTLSGSTLTVTGTEAVSGEVLNFDLAADLPSNVVVPVSDGNGGTALELAPASSDVWVGGGDGTNWSDGANWSSGVAPDGSTNAQIYLPADVTVIADDPTANHLLEFGAGTLEVACDVTLTLNGESSIANLTLDAGASLEVTCGNLAIVGDLAMGNDTQIAVDDGALAIGTTDSLSLSSDTSNATAAQLEASGNLTIAAISGNLSLTASDGSTSEIKAQGGDLKIGAIGGGITLDADGGSKAAIDATGDIAIASIGGNFSLTDTNGAETGSASVLGNDVTVGSIGGGLALSVGATFSGSNVTIGAIGGGINNSGVLGAWTGNLAFTGEIGGDVANSGILASHSGNLLFGGTIDGNLVNSGAVFGSTSGSLFIDGEIGGSVTNTGTIMAGETLSISGKIDGSFNNEGGATIQVGALAIAGGVGATFDNAGTVEISGSAGNSEVGVALNNSGYVDIDAAQGASAGGVATFTQDVTGTGSFEIGGGATADFLGNFDQSVTFTGPGVFALADPANYDSQLSDPAALSGLSAGDVIDLTSIAPSEIQSVTIETSSIVVQETANAGGATFTFNTASGVHGDPFFVLPDGQGGSALALGDRELTWTGSSGSDWGTAANWNDATTGTTASGAPDANDSNDIVLIDPASGTATIMTQGAETGSSAYLLIEGSAAMSGLFSTGILTIDNGGTLAAGGALQIEEDAVANYGAIQVQDEYQLTLTGGVDNFAAITATGRLSQSSTAGVSSDISFGGAVANTGTVQALDGGHVDSAGAFDNTGGVIASGSPDNLVPSDASYVSFHGVLTNSGTAHAEDGGHFEIYQTLDNLTGGTVDASGVVFGGFNGVVDIYNNVDNAGTLESTDGGSINFRPEGNYVIDNSGLISASGSYDAQHVSNMTIDTTLENAGTVEASDGASIYIGAVVANTGTVLVSSGGDIDLHDAVTGGSATISGGTLQFDGSSNVAVAFDNGSGTPAYGELVLSDAPQFSGVISGFAGTAPDAAHSDAIDLTDINYGSADFAEHYDSVTGLLTVTDGANTAHISFADFNATLSFASDGSGGTLVTDPPAGSGGESSAGAPVKWGMNFGDDKFNFDPAQPENRTADAAAPSPNAAPAVGDSGHDNFLFHASLGAGADAALSSHADANDFSSHPGAALVQQLTALTTPAPHAAALFDLLHDDGQAPMGTTPAQLHQLIEAGHLLH